MTLSTTAPNETHLRGLDSLTISDIKLVKGINRVDQHANIQHQMPYIATVENPGLLPTMYGGADTQSN